MGLVEFEETQGQGQCAGDGAPRQTRASLCQSLALSVFSSRDIEGDWTQRQSLQKGVR